MKLMSDSEVAPASMQKLSLGNTRPSRHRRIRPPSNMESFSEALASSNSETDTGFGVGSGVGVAEGVGVGVVDMVGTGVGSGVGVGV